MNRRQIDLIENRVSIPDVLALHGVKTYGKRCRCPIHNGTRNSFSFTDKLFHCFTCGASGGVIQLEAQIDRVDDDTALKHLAMRYGISDVFRKPTQEEQQEVALCEAIDKSYTEWQTEKNNYYNRLATLYRNIKDVPELSETAQDLGKWLDENIGGVVQEWRFQSIH